MTPSHNKEAPVVVLTHNSQCAGLSLVGSKGMSHSKKPLPSLIHSVTQMCCDLRQNQMKINTFLKHIFIWYQPAANTWLLLSYYQISLNKVKSNSMVPVAVG